MKTLEFNEFPPLLKEINDPPKKLYLEGELPNPETKLLCVVGSRKYTNYGKGVCEKLIAGLTGYDIAIVSGLALGIDSIAHRSALENNLKTIAVPGSGLDRRALYPSIHKKLAEEILKNNGALLSEFEPTFKATNWSFPQRNRIMAGMSDATLVIEAEIKSGTLITSKLATEYNRDVLTVPGSIFSSNSEGPNMLIRLGATPITKSEDILQTLNFQIDDKIQVEPEDLSPEEQKILNELDNPLSKEKLLEKLDMPISQANATLSLLEIKGLIEETMGEIRKNII